MFRDWCPATDNFGSCVNLKWTHYRCANIPSPSTDGCGSNFLKNYCSAKQTEEIRLCNGKMQKFWDGRVGITTAATAIKSPHGVLMMLYGGWSNCARYHADPAANQLLCHGSKPHAVVYKLYTGNLNSSQSDTNGGQTQPGNVDGGQTQPER